MIKLKNFYLMMKNNLYNKTIALIAHDSRKADMLEWVRYNVSTLLENKLVCTGTTGKLIKEVLQTYTSKYPFEIPEINIKNSGPMGGDAQIAAMVVQNEIDLCIFLIDDLTANPHEADIQMLLRQCRIHNIPVACNRHSADLMITSELWNTEYKPTKPLYIPYKR
jgi:methylglyoxal synthase